MEYAQSLMGPVELNALPEEMRVDKELGLAIYVVGTGNSLSIMFLSQ